MTTGDIDRERGESREHPASVEYEGGTGRARDLGDEDEFRMQRSEEELRTGSREREAGSVRLRKRVRTDRAQLRVPKRREEVHVERVPVEVIEEDVRKEEVDVDDQIARRRASEHAADAEETRRRNR